MTEHTIFLELALIIGTAAILALFGRLIKQPPIISYLLTGIIAGPFALGILSDTQIVQTLARMGIAFLLFIVGLNLDFRLLKEVGKVSFITGLGGIIVVGIFSFLISLGVGLSHIHAIYIA